MIYKIDFYAYVPKIKIYFFHFELRLDPEPDFFSADPDPRNFFFDPHHCLKGLKTIPGP